MTPTSDWTAHIHAVTLFCEDLAATRDFYTRVFGLPAQFEDETSAVFRFGSTLINLLQVGEADELITPAQVGTQAAGARAVLTLSVDSVDATCAGLLSRGVTLLNGPMDRPWGTRTASFQDPAGTVWEVAQ